MILIYQTNIYKKLSKNEVMHKIVVVERYSFKVLIHLNNVFIIGIKRNKINKFKQ
jgi:hypothetical protein